MSCPMTKKLSTFTVTPWDDFSQRVVTILKCKKRCQVHFYQPMYLLLKECQFVSRKVCCVSSVIPIKLICLIIVIFRENIVVSASQFATITCEPTISCKETWPLAVHELPLVYTVRQNPSSDCKHGIVWYFLLSSGMSVRKVKRVKNDQKNKKKKRITWITIGNEKCRNDRFTWDDHVEEKSIFSSKSSRWGSGERCKCKNTVGCKIRKRNAKFSSLGGYRTKGKSSNIHQSGLGRFEDCMFQILVAGWCTYIAGCTTMTTPHFQCSSAQLGSFNLPAQLACQNHVILFITHSPIINKSRLIDEEVYFSIIDCFLIVDFLCLICPVEFSVLCLLC
ncbi:hypothetical protein VP01_2484g1 [Puccinia sorghi]|uniref:Uncharacterized protein n=1 Tax=Puccinia sorghi TaxID=27349 RepID=A0A0L6V610_9BASI|nr:hypothetical protein VP01_2484g1 [Puccinia sorghi]